MDLVEIGCDLDSSLGYDPEVGSCEDGNGHSDSTRCSDLLTVWASISISEKTVLQGLDVITFNGDSYNVCVCETGRG